MFQPCVCLNFGIITYPFLQFACPKTQPWPRSNSYHATPLRLNPKQHLRIPKRHHPPLPLRHHPTLPQPRHKLMPPHIARKRIIHTVHHPVHRRRPQQRRQRRQAKHARRRHPHIPLPRRQQARLGLGIMRPQHRRRPLQHKRQHLPVVAQHYLERRELVKDACRVEA